MKTASYFINANSLINSLVIILHDNNIFPEELDFNFLTFYKRILVERASINNRGIVIKCNLFDIREFMEENKNYYSMSDDLKCMYLSKDIDDELLKDKYLGYLNLSEFLLLTDEEISKKVVEEYNKYTNEEKVQRTLK